MFNEGFLETLLRNFIFVLTRCFLGLARFATEMYRDDGFKNPFIHLTNYSINKKSKKFSLINQDLEVEKNGWKQRVFNFFFFFVSSSFFAFSRMKSCTMLLDPSGP